MDWKKEWVRCREKARQLGDKCRSACGTAREKTGAALSKAKDRLGQAWGRTHAWLVRNWDRASAWLGKTWEQTRSWLRKVWNRTNCWLTGAWTVTKTHTLRFWEWLKPGLKQIGVWLGEAWAWLCRAFGVLKGRCRVLAGKLAVLALKLRKWFLRRTEKLRAWWSGCKLHNWLAAKAEARRAKLPPAEETVEEEVPLALAEGDEEEALEIVEEPIRRKAPDRELSKPVLILLAIWKIIKNTVIWIWRLRKYIMAVPVGYMAVKLAIQNAHRLPDMVGLDIQASGEFARLVTRQQAVLGPLGLTAFCLVLVLCSRKPLLPWLISIFTLILPVLIWMTNLYA